MKGNLARSSCFEESRSYSDNSHIPNGGIKSASTSRSPSNAAAAKPSSASNGMDQFKEINFFTFFDPIFFIQA
jgi:hypothetical protein